MLPVRHSRLGLSCPRIPKRIARVGIQFHRHQDLRRDVGRDHYRYVRAGLLTVYYDAMQVFSRIFFQFIPLECHRVADRQAAEAHQLHKRVDTLGLARREPIRDDFQQVFILLSGEWERWWFVHLDRGEFVDAVYEPGFVTVAQETRSRSWTLDRVVEEG